MSDEILDDRMLAYPGITRFSSSVRLGGDPGPTKIASDKPASLPVTSWLFPSFF